MGTPILPSNLVIIVVAIPTEMSLATFGKKLDVYFRDLHRYSGRGGVSGSELVK